MLNRKTGPDWIQRGDLRFNVEAKAEDPSKTTEQQLLSMLQNLLVDRFQLRFHYERLHSSRRPAPVSRRVRAPRRRARSR
jgi:uncharacterized protein (TIGR03435 family)